jgi:ABC-type multidrug transport system fused ATPase/permease subunit
MAELMKGRTRFVIAHRLSTIQSTDLILVIKDGKITESGNHNQLLHFGGFYSTLYNFQFN